MIPEICWRGIFDDYRTAMSAGITETPDDFHFAGLLTVLGAVIGRTAYFWLSENVYANQYTVLVGPSGQHKTTAIKLALGLTDIKTLQNLNSAEGLITALDINPSILVVKDEYTHIFAKSKQDGGSTLLQFLNEVYGSPDKAEIVTKNKPVEVNNPYISIFSGTPPDWLHETLEPYHFTSGFLNRFSFYVGEDKEPISLPDKPELKAIRRRVKSIETRARPRRYFMDEAARVLFDDWYIRHKKSIPENEWHANLAIRLPVKVIKLALVYAVCEGTSEITADQVEAAIAFAEYQRETMEKVFGTHPLGVNKDEERVLRLIESPMPVSTLHQRVGGRISALKLSQMLEKLEQLERVKRWTPEGEKRVWVARVLTP